MLNTASELLQDGFLQADLPRLHHLLQLLGCSALGVPCCLGFADALPGRLQPCSSAALLMGTIPVGAYWCWGVLEYRGWGLPSIVRWHVMARRHR